MKMFKHLKAVTFALSIAISASLISVSLPSVAYAQSKTATVYTKFTTQQLLNIVKKRYPNSEIPSSNKNFIRIFVSDDNKLILNNSYSDGSLQIAAFYNDSIALSKLNKWNRDKRFAMAYLDDDGEVVLSYDIDVKGGVTEETILQFIDRMVAVDLLFNMAMASD